MCWINNIVDYLIGDSYQYITPIKITIENYKDTKNYKAYFTQPNKWPVHLDIVYDIINKKYLGIKLDIEYQNRLDGYPYLIDNIDVFIEYLDKLVDLNRLCKELKDCLIKLIKN